MRWRGGPQVSPSCLPVVKKVKNKIKINAVPTPEKIPEPAKPVKKSKKSKVPVPDPVPDSEFEGAGGGRVTCRTFLTSKNTRKK
jgi:hypothetical protein